MVCAEESVGANKMIASNKAFNDFFMCLILRIQLIQK